MTRKQRADSTTAAVKAMSNAAQPIPIPEFVQLDDNAAAIWPIVVRGRARDEWSDADLTVAGDICRCMADMKEQSDALKLEGYIITNERGTPIQNPRNQVIEVLTRRKVSLMRLLQMQPRAVQGSGSRVKEARVLERRSEAALPDDDQFLAAPIFQ